MDSLHSGHYPEALGTLPKDLYPLDSEVTCRGPQSCQNQQALEPYILLLAFPM